MKPVVPAALLAFLVNVSLALFHVPASRAEDYPDRQITMVVPVAAGGAVDVLGRLFAQQLASRLGKPVVVENRTGAGMITGPSSVARGAPEGYTLLVATSSPLAINAAIHRKLPYDPVEDFVPIALIANSPFTLIVNPSLPVKSVPDLVKLATDKPGQLSYASAGPGSPHHLFFELLKATTGIQATHVPYRGNVPAITDVIAGHVPVMFSDPSGLPIIRDGKVRAIGASTAKRLLQAPDVPTIAEQGLSGFDAAAWIMVVAPAKTPPGIVSRLHEELKTISQLPDVQAQIVKNGQTPTVTPSVPELQKFVQSELVRWGKVVQTAGIAGSQ
jgi:tripartite-type tricarboxylate transporter receptor subunit TctC